MPIHNLGPEAMLRPPQGIKSNNTNPKIFEDSVKKSAEFNMAEQGPSTTFQHLEVPMHSLGADTMLRAPLGLECNNTNLKIIEDFVKKSVEFGYGRTES